MPHPKAKLVELVETVGPKPTDTPSLTPKPPSGEKPIGSVTRETPSETSSGSTEPQLGSVAITVRPPDPADDLAFLQAEAVVAADPPSGVMLAESRFSSVREELRTFLNRCAKRRLSWKNREERMTQQVMVMVNAEVAALAVQGHYRNIERLLQLSQQYAQAETDVSRAKREDYESRFGR